MLRQVTPQPQLQPERFAGQTPKQFGSVPWCHSPGTSALPWPTRRTHEPHLGDLRPEHSMGSADHGALTASACPRHRRTYVKCNHAKTRFFTHYRVHCRTSRQCMIHCSAFSCLGAQYSGSVLLEKSHRSLCSCSRGLPFT